MLEQQRTLAVFSQHTSGEGLDRAVLIQQPTCRHAADPGDPRISVLRVTDQGEQIGDQLRLHPELLAYGYRIADFLGPAIDLHYPIGFDALREVFVVGPDAHLIDPFIV